MNFNDLNLFMGLTMRGRWILLSRVVIIGVCLLGIFRGRPPASAQDITRSYPDNPTRETQKLIYQYQQDDIARVSQQVKDLTSVVETQRAEIDAIRVQQTSTDTKMNGFLALITVLTSGGIILQIRKKKEF